MRAEENAVRIDKKDVAVCSEDSFNVTVCVLKFLLQRREDACVAQIHRGNTHLLGALQGFDCGGLSVFEFIHTSGEVERDCSATHLYRLVGLGRRDLGFLGCVDRGVIGMQYLAISIGVNLGELRRTNRQKIVVLQREPALGEVP